MVKALQVIATLLLISISTSALADTVYVSDSLRVGVRTEPENRGDTISVVVTGMALQVLDRRGNYMLVRTSNGVEGWVNSNYVSRKKPAKLLLEASQKENEQLTKQVSELKSNVEDLEYSRTKLNDQNEELVKKNKQLQKQVDDAFDPNQLISGSNRPLWQNLLLLAVVIAISMGLGMLIYRRQLTKKLGGMSL